MREEVHEYIAAAHALETVPPDLMRSKNLSFSSSVSNSCVSDIPQAIYGHLEIRTFVCIQSILTPIREEDHIHSIRRISRLTECPDLQRWRLCARGEDALRVRTVLPVNIRSDAAGIGGARDMVVSCVNTMVSEGIGKEETACEGKSTI